LSGVVVLDVDVERKQVQATASLPDSLHNYYAYSNEDMTIISLRFKWYGIIIEIHQKNLKHRVPPFKATENKTDRSATYDFLLVIHSNHGHLSQTTISEINGNFYRKLL